RARDSARNRTRTRTIRCRFRFVWSSLPLSCSLASRGIDLPRVCRVASGELVVIDLDQEVSMGAKTHEIVTFFDLDNTLLDNDAITADLHRYLDAEVGTALSHRYWEIFEELRIELGYADYLGALQRYRTETAFDPCVLSMSSFLLDYPFPDRL